MNTTLTNTEIALQNILVATDFSPTSQRALRYATAIATRYGSRVHLVHVVQPVALEFLEPATISEYEQAAEEALRKEAEQLTELRHEIHVADGGASQSVQALVREHGIDLIVLGTHGKKGLTKALLGSTAEEIFRGATCPVLTVGPNTPAMDAGKGLNCILFPTDLMSDESGALAHAISLAKHYGAHLVLLHVIAGVQPPPPNEKNLLDSPYRNRLERLIPAEVELPHPAECRIEYQGPAPDVILRVAAELAADLIVLSVRPEDAWATRLPDKAYRIVAGAACPVLTVREKESA